MTVWGLGPCAALGCHSTDHAKRSVALSLSGPVRCSKPLGPRSLMRLPTVARKAATISRSVGLLETVRLFLVLERERDLGSECNYLAFFKFHVHFRDLGYTQVP